MTEPKRSRGRPRKMSDPPKMIKIQNPLPDFLDTLRGIIKDGKAKDWPNAIQWIVNEYKIRRSLLR